MFIKIIKTKIKNQKKNQITSITRYTYVTPQKSLVHSMKWPKICSLTNWANVNFQYLYEIIKMHNYIFT